jgi:hypothetical protein
MALVLGLAVGDVVDIADYWIAVLSVDSRMTATVHSPSARAVNGSRKRYFGSTRQLKG